MYRFDGARSYSHMTLAGPVCNLLTCL